MRRAHLLLLVLFLPIPALAFERPFGPPSLALIHVTVIDATGASPMSDATVVIVGDRIAALGRSGRIDVPRDAKVIDATGKYLIPGLWDMHVHTGYKETYLPLYVANGITGVRDMGGDLDHPTGAESIHMELLIYWRKQIALGALIGPYIVVSGPHIDGPGWPSNLAVRTASEGRRGVIDLKRRGVDFVKVYDKLSRDAYFAIADEATKQGMPFAGHVPRSVTALEASNAGQKSMEHLIGIPLECFAEDETQLRRWLADEGVPAAEVNEALAEYRRCNSLFSAFARNGTWQVPTLTILRRKAVMDDTGFVDDPRKSYLPAQERREWSSYAEDMKRRSLENIAENKRRWLVQLRLIGRMHRAGVRFLAGTDSANPYVFPGFALHDELLFLTQAGLTPMEALQAATRNPAEFLGLGKSYGTIAKGKIASLVLLEANPIEDIRCTQRIAAVILRGQYFTKEALQTMLADAKAAASSQ
jgi:imidazolonepropionase-like amidohydrolase